MWVFIHVLSGIQPVQAFDPTSFDVDRFIPKLDEMPRITFDMAKIRRNSGSLSKEARSKLSRYYLPAPLPANLRPETGLYKLSELDTPFEGAIISESS